MAAEAGTENDQESEHSAPSSSKFPGLETNGELSVRELAMPTAPRREKAGKNVGGFCV